MKFRTSSFFALLFVTVLLGFGGCKDSKNDPVSLVFSIQEDKALGLQLHDEIASDPDQFPILDREEYADAYLYLEGLRDQVLDASAIRYKDEFDWKVHIIHDDVLNAFAAPGGYIYFYTGLIDYLKNEDDLMGVLGHEIAHADRRHSVNQMLKAYGIDIVISMALGNDPSQVEQVVAGLAGNATALKFSRNDEAEADDYSVQYLSETEYRCDGAATFFEQLIAEGQTGGVPTFLSTHPDPEDRVDDIHAKAIEIGCDTSYLAPASYDDFKAMLPQ